MWGQCFDSCAEGELDRRGGGEEVSAEAVSGWRGRGRRGRGVARKEQGGEETFVVPKREMGVQENLTIADQVEVATRGQDIISDGTS